MLLPKFDFHEPKTLHEARQILAEYGTKAKLIAGGTDLMVNMKKKILSPQQVVSISRIGELKKLDTSGDSIRIGACFTVAELITSDAIQKNLGALGEGAKNLGTPLIRNLATIGGNLGSARPAADLPPALMDPEGIIRNARIVMGCVGPIPLRARTAEKMLIGQKAESTLFSRAGAAASSDSTPIDDFRGTAVYKRDMVGVLTRRTLDIAFHEATHRQ